MPPTTNCRPCRRRRLLPELCLRLVGAGRAMRAAAGTPSESTEAAPLNGVGFDGKKYCRRHHADGLMRCRKVAMRGERMVGRWTGGGRGSG